MDVMAELCYERQTEIIVAGTGSQAGPGFSAVAVLSFLVSRLIYSACWRVSKSVNCRTCVVLLFGQFVIVCVCVCRQFDLFVVCFCVLLYNVRRTFLAF